MARESLMTETRIEDEQAALTVICPFETDPTRLSFYATKQAFSVRSRGTRGATVRMTGDDSFM